MKRYRSLTLAAWLSGGTMAILVMAVATVAVLAIGTLRNLSERAALARARLASVASLNYLLASSEALQRSALLLAARPSLEQFLREGDQPRIALLLKAHCETIGLDACAVIGRDGVIAVAGAPLPWQEWREAAASQGERLTFSPRSGGPMISGAMGPVPAVPGVQAAVARLLDARLAREIESQVAATVRITSMASAAESDKGFADLHGKARAGGQPAAQRIEDRGVHAASVPLADRSGAPIGFIDIELPTTPSDANLRYAALRFGGVSMLIIALAGFGGLLYGHWLVRPLKTLQAAASRIGKGDFTPTMAASGVSEVAALARTMDDMRTSLMQLTAALRQREAEANAVLSGVTEGVFAVDEERRIRYANPQLGQMLNLTTEDVVGRFCGDVLQPATQDGVRPCEISCPIVAARSVNHPGHAAEQLCVTGRGTRSVVIVSAPPMGGQQVQVLRDETELETARRVRDSVLANISHEFRTPLAAQLASIEVLQEGLPTLTQPELRQLLDGIQRSGVRLMRLVDNLLESVRIEAGRLTIRRHPVALQELVEDAASIMQPILRQRRQELVRQLPGDLPGVIGDAQRLTQVLLNLLANASKFAPEATMIRIGGTASAGEVRVWIEDEGPGIADADRNAIYQPFSRGAAGEPQVSGLGLGLWIARSIIERHGGRLGVERTPEDRTRFTFALPAVAEP